MSGSLTTALVASSLLDKHPGATVLYNCICSRVVPEVDRREGRRRRAHQGRPQLHQAGDGRDRGRVRWRALGPLLLPGQLPGRLGDHRRHAGARAAERHRQAAVGAAGPVQAVCGLRRDQHGGRRPGRRRRADGGRGRGGGRRPRHGRPARRSDRRPGRLVVQPASVEHRAAPAPQRRGTRRGRPAPPGWPRCRRRSPACSAPERRRPDHRTDLHDTQRGTHR